MRLLNQGLPAWERLPASCECGAPTGLPWHPSSGRPLWTFGSGRSVLHLFLHPKKTLGQFCFHLSLLPFPIITQTYQKQFVSASRLSARPLLCPKGIQPETHYRKQPRLHLQTSRFGRGGDLIGLANGIMGAALKLPVSETEAPSLHNTPSWCLKFYHSFPSFCVMENALALTCRVWTRSRYKQS